MSLNARARRYLAARGPTETFVQLFRFAWRKVRPNESPAVRRRRRLGRDLFGRFDGTVQAGPVKGLRLNPDSSWGAADHGPMLLGLYEDHVCAALAEAGGDTRVFVDIGSADGYFAVGMVASGSFARAVCFEMDPISRAALGDLARLNGVADRVTIHGTADADLVRVIEADGVRPRDAVVLCDIEGFEFELLSAPVLRSLAGATIVVELHDAGMADGAARLERLRRDASEFFDVAFLDRRPQAPFDVPALAGMPEDDQWLLCSEGRMIPQRWLILRPSQSDVQPV